MTQTNLSNKIKSNPINYHQNYPHHRMIPKLTQRDKNPSPLLKKKNIRLLLLPLAF
jgi:hypothetical protein